MCGRSGSDSHASRLLGAEDAAVTMTHGSGGPRIRTSLCENEIVSVVEGG
jgi:hypothetical protein